MSQEHFTGLADLLPEALLVVSADGQILAANRSARDLLGRNEVAGQELISLLNGEAGDLSEFLRACSRCRNRVLGALSLLSEGGVAECRAEGFLLQPRADDALARVLLRLLPKESTTARFLLLNERIEQLCREVAARQRAEEALRQERELLQVTLGSIGDAVIATDNEGRITFQNAVAAELTGWDNEQALGKPLTEVFRIVNEYSGEPVENPVTKVILENRIVTLANHTILISRDGEERPIADSGAPIRDSHGSLHGVVLVFRDVTEKKQADERRQQLLESERAARTEAERASRMKDEFLATLSHELRTPLNAIMGYATLLEMGGHSEEEAADWINTINKNARAQAQLIEDLLDMNRIISGKIRLDVQPVDLATVIDAALQTIQPSADAKQLRIRRILDPIAGVVRGDPNRVQQIVWNLLSNAVKFSNKGGRINVSLERVNSHVEISVSDNGVGISPEFLPHVFDRFRQADSSITRQISGLGLGLSIVKQLVELHGGTIKAKSRGEGHGATFVVSLPLAVVHQEDRRLDFAQQPESSSDCLPDLEGLSILVVDDEPDACALVARLLTRCHASVDLAHSAEGAWTLLQSGTYHVLISDIGMPQQDGYELMRMVRSSADDRLRNISALALTAFARSEDRRRAALAGFQAHLGKPVEAMELLAVVASLAGRTGRS